MEGEDEGETEEGEAAWEQAHVQMRKRGSESVGRRVEAIEYLNANASIRLGRGSRDKRLLDAYTSKRLAIILRGMGRWAIHWGRLIMLLRRKSLK